MPPISSGPSAAQAAHGQPKIVAVFDYRDENRNLLYQSLRREPGANGARKDFRQRQPDGKGGWSWNLQGARIILYRLPELLAAEPKAQVLFIAEGEGKVDALRELGLVATCCPMGAGKWRQHFNPFFAGWHVIVLPDNDDPGRKHARDVQLQLHGVAASVHILELPGLGPKGDVINWLEAGGSKEQLLELAAALPSVAQGNCDADDVTVPAPRPAPPGILPMQPFPVAALPEPLCSYVQQAAIAIGCDPVFIVLPLLTALGAAIGNSRWIEMKSGKRGWKEPPLLWTAMIGKSGTRKSAGLDAAVDFTKERQIQLAADHKRAITNWRIASEEDPDESPDKPTMQRVLISDITVEKVIGLLKDNGRGLLLYRDELSGWLGSFNQYRQGQKGGDMEHYLSMHRAGSISYDRKSDEGKSIHVPFGFVAITGGVQPGILRDALSDRFFEAGLVARFLFASPPEKKCYWTELEIHPDTVAAVDNVFRKLWELQMRKTAHGSYPELLKFNPEAKQLWVKFYDEHQDEKFEREDALRSAWSKFEAYCARLALVMFLVRAAAGPGIQAEQVDVESLELAMRLTDWFKTETERIYAMLSETDLPGTDDNDVLVWLGSFPQGATVRELQHNFRRRFPAAEDAERCFERLLAAGRLKPVNAPTTARGGRPTVRYVLA